MERLLPRLDLLEKTKLLISLPPLNFKLPDAIFAGIVFGTVILTIIFHYVRQNVHGKKMP